MDFGAIRVVSSLLYTYKAIHAVSKKLPRINTIESPMPDVSLTYLDAFDNFIKLFVKEVLKVKKPLNYEKLIPKDYPFLRSAGPNGPISGLAVQPDCWLHACDFQRRPKDSPLKLWIEHLNHEHLIEGIMDVASEYEKLGPMPYTANAPRISRRLAQWNPLSYSLEDLINGTRDFTARRKDEVLSFGKLVFLREPAGKVRVIAIVDSLRQWALKPVHDLLYDFCKKFPGDASMSQDASTWEFAQKGNKEIFSYDLSSATDMIPKSLYLSAMKPILGWPACKL